MSSKVVCDISISADGYVAGPGQTADKPFGDGPVDLLHAWMFDTPDENKAEVDQITSAGGYVMGRNMFGPVRGAWDLDWKGWWGDNPPYHAPVFVLTHHPRDPVTMRGRTTFTFVTDGIHSALDQARAAAVERDVASQAVPPRSTSTSPQVSSMSCAPTLPRSPSAPEDDSSMEWAPCTSRSSPPDRRRSSLTSATASPAEVLSATDVPYKEALRG
jgi:dihydrofolate reductase